MTAIRGCRDGKSAVMKTEKRRSPAPGPGAGSGALVGLVFPPALIGSATVGAGAGA